MNWLRKLFSRRAIGIPVNEVFTPGRPAQRLFVARSVEERRLTNQLRSTGTQIVIFGESGAGKSSLAERVLKKLGQEYAITRCTASTTYEELLASGFDRAQAKVTTETTQKSELKSASSSKMAVNGVGIGVEVEGTTSSGLVQRSAVDYQINEGNLADAFKMSALVWVVEDFHKVSDDVRRSFAELMKVFSDSQATVVILGARENADEVVTFPDANLRHRVAAIELRPLADEELGELLDAGGDFLNIDFSNVRRTIVLASAGVASTAHGLAKACLDDLQIHSTSDDRKVITPAVLSRAANEYVETLGGHIRERFSKAITQVGTKKRKFKNYLVVVHALATFEQHGATHAELLERIRALFHPDYPAGNLSQYLIRLGEEVRGEVIRKSSDGKFRFDTPLHLTYARIYFEVNDHDDIFAASLSSAVPPEAEREKVR